MKKFCALANIEHVRWRVRPSNCLLSINYRYIRRYIGNILRQKLEYSLHVLSETDSSWVHREPKTVSRALPILIFQSSAFEAAFPDYKITLQILSSTPESDFLSHGLKNFIMKSRLPEIGAVAASEATLFSGSEATASLGLGSAAILGLVFSSGTLSTFLLLTSVSVSLSAAAMIRSASSMISSSLSDTWNWIGSYAWSDSSPRNAGIFLPAVYISFLPSNIPKNETRTHCDKNYYLKLSSWFH